MCLLKVKVQTVIDDYFEKYLINEWFYRFIGFKAFLPLIRHMSITFGQKVEDC